MAVGTNDYNKIPVLAVETEMNDSNLTPLTKLLQQDFVGPGTFGFMRMLFYRF